MDFSDGAFELFDQLISYLPSCFAVGWKPYTTVYVMFHSGKNVEMFWTLGYAL